MKKGIFLTIVLVLLLSSCGNSNKSPNVANDSQEQKSLDETLDAQIIYTYKKLYDELQGFKSKNDFKEMGFAPAGLYKSWYDKVVQAGIDEPKEFILEHGICASDLLNLGLEYVNSKGLDNDKTGYYTRRFEALFNPENLDDGTSIDNVDIAKGNVIGKWQVKNKYAPNDPGFTIEIINEGDVYISIEAGKKKKLKKTGDKYYVIGDVDNTYYMIINGNLRFYGIDGDYTDQAGWIITPTI